MVILCHIQPGTIAYALYYTIVMLSTGRNKSISRLVEFARELVATYSRHSVMTSFPTERPTPFTLSDANTIR